ncbi:MAG: hypothetical protein JWN38_251 [Candidatus Saccharibacteria bacterium]|nr:hypothetical protein [Candidatus Saccharibacteria bacterium]
MPETYWDDQRSDFSRRRNRPRLVGPGEGMLFGLLIWCMLFIIMGASLQGVTSVDTRRLIAWCCLAGYFISYTVWCMIFFQRRAVLMYSSTLLLVIGLFVGMLYLMNWYLNSV